MQPTCTKCIGWLHKIPNQSLAYPSSTSSVANVCGCTALDMPEWKGNDRAGRLAGKAATTGGLRHGRSEVLRSLRRYGHKAKYITFGITWRREAWKEEALDDLSWKDERGPLAIRRISEMFRRQHWEHFWETERSTHGLFPKHKYHFELNPNQQTYWLTPPACSQQ